MNAQAPALIRDIAYPPESLRLPYYPELEAFGIDNVRWKVLTDTIFPHAKTTDSILMAMAYCKARNLDIMKRPVHIVPIYSTAQKKLIDTIWPSIAELRTTAARTGEYAGKDETVFGPDKTAKLGAVEITFPEWAQTTVYRIIKGVRCPFVGPRCYWLEYYATAAHDKKDPNDRWKRATHGQIEKCAEAGALRMAFPEELGNDYAAEEMEGQVIIEGTTAPVKRVAPPPPAKVSDAAPEAPAEASAPIGATAGVEGEQTKRRAPPPPPGAAKPAEKPPSYAENAAAFFRRYDARLAQQTDGDGLQEIYMSMIDPIWEDMDAADREQADGIYRQHERRLEP